MIERGYFVSNYPTHPQRNNIIGNAFCKQYSNNFLNRSDEITPISLKVFENVISNGEIDK